MMKLFVKLLICLLLYVAYFSVMFTIGMNGSVVGKKAVRLEVILLLAIQIPVILTYFIRPFTVQSHKIIYCITAVALALVTAWFWLIFIIGPVWKL